MTRSQRSGSVPCALLLSLQLADFNKENTAVCFLCAFKLETCLVPTVPLEEVSMDVPSAGAAPSSARRGSAPCFPSLLPCLPPGTLRPGMGGLTRRPAVPGAGGGVRCPRRARPRQEGDETSPGKAPRRAASEVWGRGGRLPRGQSRWLARTLAPLLARSMGVPGMRGLERGSPPWGAGKCLRSCPLPGPRPHPPGALGGSVGAGGSAGWASLRFACAELLCAARLAGRSSQVLRLASGCPSAKRRVS